MNKEIERKYLIEYPNIKELKEKSFSVKNMVQTYLCSEPSVDRRVRAAEENGKTVYTFTEKRKLSGITRQEDEREITKEEYDALLHTADKEFFPVYKTRYCVAVNNRVAEVDVYRNITSFAICETELESEDEVVPLPAFLTLIREVTGDKEYTNRKIAKMK